jgi:hypothetical protein
VVSGGGPIVSNAGLALLTRAATRTGLAEALSAALAGWRLAGSVHDPAKMLVDMAVTVAAGGDCLSDTAMLRNQPGLAGRVASPSTMWRLIDQLAGQPRMLDAVRRARSTVRQHVWRLAGDASPVDADGGITIDLDAAIVIAHSDKQSAAPTWKHTYGFHPLLAFVDHGPDGTGEPVAALLRPGNAGSNTAADHITVTRDALAQLPRTHRRGRATLIRTDSAGGTHQFVDWLARRGRWLSYSVGMTITPDIHTAILAVPRGAWTPAYDANGMQRDGAWVAEITGMLDLTDWPQGLRLIVRKERPHPGAQLRITDIDGNRVTCMATNTGSGQIAELELRHRRRARCEDRIRAARTTGLTNLPFRGFTHNQIWLDIVSLAADLLAWTTMLALTGPARRWEPKTLRLRLFATAGRLVHTGRRLLLRLPDHWPFTDLLLTALARLDALPAPG